jgi:cation:H+ antiporter
VWLDVIRLFGGMLALIYAADRLVRAAVTISRAFDVSAVLIGAVVIGVGTSVPEFVVSGLAAVEGQLDLAVGNVVSSNTANVTLVLGGAAVVSALAANRRVIRREGLLMLAAVVILAVVLLDGRLWLVEGLGLIALLAVAVYLMMLWSTDDPSSVANAFDDFDTEFDLADRGSFGPDQWRRVIGREIIVAALALVVTVVAAQFMLEGLLGIGERLGFSVVFLGLITGVGTSLPELAASVAAARHRQPELAIGNVLGSNIFNSLGVTGFAILLAPGRLEALTPMFLGVMVAAALVAGVFAYTGHRIQRSEGVILLAAFVAYAVLAYG